jgi:hypothetical protein
MEFGMTVDLYPLPLVKGFSPITECSTGRCFSLILGNEDKYAGEIAH